MNRFLLMLLAAFTVAAAVPLAGTTADKGNAPPTLSFFSSGGGAHAGWVHRDDDSPNDADQQAMQIRPTTTDFAGVLVHHVYGMPTATFPNSTFELAV